VTAHKLQAFGGMLPAWDERLLPDGQASAGLNCYLFSGALIGWRQPKFLRRNLLSTTKYVYRLPNRESNNTLITAGDSFWMEFDNADTTVMRTPVVNDKYQRYYWASPTQSPTYNTYERITGVHGACVNPQPPFSLGVPAPPVPPVVTVAGGGEISQLGFPTLAESGGGFDQRPANCIFLVPITPNGTLLVKSVSFIAPVDDPTINLHAVVYTDLNGKPHNLLGYGTRVTGLVAGTTVVSTITNTVSVISNVTYWVGFAHDAALSVPVADETTHAGAYATNTFANGPPPVIASATGYPTWQVWADLKGDSILEARAYVYTWVTEFQEEGPPSQPTLLNGWSNAIWTVTLTPPAPPDPHYTKTRIYRSVTSQTGVGTYFFVEEIPIDQTVYTDVSDDKTVALNEQLPSLNWNAPPTDLQAIIGMPNGITIGFRKNEIWFAEPYHPHAWPPAYVITTEFPIVGIGVCGQTAVICTAGTPYLVTGVHPSTMALTKINLHEPCLHRGSIVATDTTVLYVSPNGLIQINQSGAGGNVTEGWVSRERWMELTPVKFVRAIKNTTAYFAFGTVSGGDTSVARQGFTIELSGEDQTSFTIWPQPGGHRLGFMPMSSPNGFDIVNVLSDAWTGVALLVQNNAVYYYDFTDLHPIIVPYRWKSKAYQHQSRKNFQALRIWFSVPDTTPVQVDRNTDDPQPTLGPNQYGVVRVYADEKLWTTRELRKSGELMRIYAGSVYETWHFEIEGRVRVTNMQVATSVKELGLV
jgi:hypothetical protein